MSDILKLYVDKFIEDVQERRIKNPDNIVDLALYFTNKGRPVFEYLSNECDYVYKTRTKFNSELFFIIVNCEKSVFDENLTYIHLRFRETNEAFVIFHEGVLLSNVIIETGDIGDSELHVVNIPNVDLSERNLILLNKFNKLHGMIHTYFEEILNNYSITTLLFVYDF